MWHSLTHLFAPSVSARPPIDCRATAYANQVLQHLSDPVAALVELRRVVKAGGLVAVRDADYSSMTGWPSAMDAWRRIYRQTCRKNGAEPDAGRFLVQASGFTTL